MPHSVSSDVRFGSTFLDVRYENQAVNGEVLSDKQDAELFLKRPSDGRVVAYSEKVASIYQIISELNIEFQSATGYLHPTNPSSLFMISRFKTNKLTNIGTRDIDILHNNLVFRDTTAPGLSMRCEISNDTNGFFIKPYLRHVDRNLVGYLTGLFKTYEETGITGASSKTFGEWLASSSLYGTDSYSSLKRLNYWSQSNAIVYYQTIAEGYDSNNEFKIVKTSSQYCIRLNEQSFVTLPPGYKSGLKTVSKVTLKIARLDFPKLQYAYEISGLASDPTKLKGFMEDDGKLMVRDTALYYFIDDIYQRVAETDTTSTYFCVDWEFLKESMNKATLNTGGGVYSKPEHPEVGEWLADSMWVEEVRKVKSGNKTEQLNCETTMEVMEEYIYLNNEIETELTLDQTNTTAVYVKKI